MWTTFHLSLTFFMVIHIAINNHFHIYFQGLRDFYTKPTPPTTVSTKSIYIIYFLLHQVQKGIYPHETLISKRLFTEWY